MILPIVAYGSPVLRKLCKDIPKDYPQLDKLVADMWETMYNSNGVGLAAPQINKDIRLFVIDSTQVFSNLDFSFIYDRCSGGPGNRTKNFQSH